MTTPHPDRYISREMSWLAFNDRVLQEAADPTTPLIERIKFLGIFSSNLDEFFRVRVGTLKRMAKEDKKGRGLLDERPSELLGRIEAEVKALQERFDALFAGMREELEQKKIFLISEKDVTPDQADFLRDYLDREVRPKLFPIMISAVEKFPTLRDHSIYLAVDLRKKPSSAPKYAILEVPTKLLSRFLVLPPRDGNTYIMLLDDVIRFGLRDIFSMFGFTSYAAYTVKLTRDAEIDLDDDITMSFFEKISRGIKQRKKGEPVRVIYDSEMPPEFLQFIIKKSGMGKSDTIIPGGRYHNFKDFMGFPSVGKPDLRYIPFPPRIHPDLDPRKSMLKVIRSRDVLLHYPYQSFNSMIDLLREASLDAKVESIKMTLYRVAKDSSIVNALIRAARNGKSVTVVIELQARFDEESNIYWTDRLREEGIRIIHGVPNLKVHGKLCLISRRERGALVQYVNISTGNYNENTARVYSDHSLFTTDTRIGREVVKVFEFFENNYRTSTFDHLMVAPFCLRKKLIKLVRREMKHAREGLPCGIIIKSNSLYDREMIDLLYEASEAGVPIRLLVRGICSLVPGQPGLSENITAVSIVDRFLEHSRIFVFHNNGDEDIFIASADWMTRNLDRRIEIACPIYDSRIKRELMEYLDIQFRDNTKARIISASRDNSYRTEPGEPTVRAQEETYRLIQKRADDCL